MMATTLVRQEMMEAGLQREAGEEWLDLRDMGRPEWTGIGGLVAVGVRGREEVRMLPKLGCKVGCAIFLGHMHRLVDRYLLGEARREG